MELQQEKNKNSNQQSKETDQWKNLRKNPVKRRSSLFGTTAENRRIELQEAELKAIEQYNKQMLNELKNWDKLIEKGGERLAEIQKMQLNPGVTVLTEDQKKYIDTGLNLLDQYFSGLAETKQRINFYLEQRMLILESKHDLYDQLNQIGDEETMKIIEATMNN